MTAASKRQRLVRHNVMNTFIITHMQLASLPAAPCLTEIRTHRMRMHISPQYDT